MTRKELIRIIIEDENGKGRVEDLLKKIGPANFNQFCLMGLIKRGIASVNNEPVDTWAITNALQNEYDFFYGSLNEKEKIIANRFAPARFK